MVWNVEEIKVCLEGRVAGPTDLKILDQFSDEQVKLKLCKSPPNTRPWTMAEGKHRERVNGASGFTEPALGNESVNIVK